jgi:hypothetical protein
MSAQQRHICEFLMLNPGSTSADIIEGTGYPYDSVKKKLRALRESGHVQGGESRYRSSFQLTGKSFPRLADYRPNPKYAAKKARIATRETRRDVLFAAMHAMVTVGRACA